MQLRKLKCPNCGGTLDINLDDKEYIFCPYCGEKCFVEDGKKEYTINQNINIKKDININKQTSHTRHNIDEADVIRAKTEDSLSSGCNLSSFLQTIAKHTATLPHTRFPQTKKA